SRSPRSRARAIIRRCIKSAQRTACSNWWATRPTGPTMGIKVRTLLRFVRGWSVRLKQAWPERNDVYAGAFLLVAVSVFHWRGLLPGQTFLAVDLASTLPPWRVTLSRPLQNPLISDPIWEFYPFLSATTRAVQQGEYALWNPEIFLGQPSVADPLALPF